MPSNNLCIIASAGSRKTTGIVKEALSNRDRRVLITTYTNENIRQIEQYVIEKIGYVPDNITVISWFSFLLQEGVRPYQNLITNMPRTVSINFISRRPLFVKKADVDAYYFDSASNLYSDSVSDLVVAINDKSSGCVISRLEKMFDHIFVDEVQDMNGYDLDLLELFMKSSIDLTLVGDPRQSTFSTNRGTKNRKYKRLINEWFEEKKNQNLCKIEERNECFRSNQAICSFSDNLYPALRRSISRNTLPSGHDGIFQISADEVKDYLEQYNPAILRYSKSTNTQGYPALNIGAVKGKTYDRVLIFPTAPMKKYLLTNDISKAGDVSKLYVAVTRARHSATFVV